MSVDPSTKTLVLSQDYELFFQRSGSVEKCMLEPTAALLEFAETRRITLTFFVDAGMLRCFDRYAAKSARVARDAQAVRDNLRQVARAGHEIALHIHPHWEDTRLVDGHWDFTATRYQLGEFSDAEAAEVFREYFRLLQELTPAPITAYRAGGFCIEPFSRIAAVMQALGVDVESSVVPGARLIDPVKGFDFSSAPDRYAWQFNASPSLPEAGGAFTEIPVTPNTVSRFFYWGRLLDRLGGQQRGEHFGDGVSKAIGRQEILRRLSGGSRTSELSVDDAKAGYLEACARADPGRSVWHVMGHPKLLSRRALSALDRFVDAAGIGRFRSVSGLAADFCAAASR